MCKCAWQNHARVLDTTRNIVFSSRALVQRGLCVRYPCADTKKHCCSCRALVQPSLCVRYPCAGAGKHSFRGLCVRYPCADVKNIAAVAVHWYSPVFVFGTLVPAQKNIVFVVFVFGTRVLTQKTLLQLPCIGTVQSLCSVPLCRRKKNSFRGLCVRYPRADTKNHCCSCRALVQPSLCFRYPCAGAKEYSFCGLCVRYPCADTKNIAAVAVCWYSQSLCSVPKLDEKWRK